MTPGETVRIQLKWYTAQTSQLSSNTFCTLYKECNLTILAFRDEQEQQKQTQITGRNKGS